MRTAEDRAKELMQTIPSNATPLAAVAYLSLAFDDHANERISAAVKILDAAIDEAVLSMRTQEYIGLLNKLKAEIAVLKEFK